MTYTKSATIERAKAVVKQLHERNHSTWNELDRETVHAINALVAYAEWLRSNQKSKQEQPKPELLGYFRYDLRLDAWVQNRAEVTGIPFYVKRRKAHDQRRTAGASAPVQR